jgi:hypothetical protein
MEKLRKSYMKDGKLDDKRMLLDPKHGDLVMQLAEVEAQLNPDAPPPEIIYDTIKRGWWLWKKEETVPIGVERRPAPTGARGGAMPDRTVAPSRPTTGGVGDLINRF